jgi:hypothetical protein
MRLTSARRTKLRAVAALGALLAIAACSNATKSSDQSPTFAADTPPATEAQVLAAVKEAQTDTTLPASISPDQLTKIANGDISLWGIDGCNPRYETSSLDDITPCTVGTPTGAHTMVVIGDSNALMWAKGLDLIGKRQGWRIVVLGKDNCGPAALTYYQYQLGRDLTECDTWQKWRMDQINTIKPAAVLLIGWYGANTGPNRPLTPEIWRDALIKTIEEISPGIKTALLANTPHVTVNPGDCLAKHLTDISKCAEEASAVVPTDANNAIEQAAAATKSDYVDVTPWFCDTTCPAAIAGYAPYAGKYHITHDYAMYLSGVLADALRPVMT